MSHKKVQIKLLSCRKMTFLRRGTSLHNQCASPHQVNFDFPLREGKALTILSTVRYLDNNKDCYSNCDVLS